MIKQKLLVCCLSGSFKLYEIQEKLHSKIDGVTPSLLGRNVAILFGFLCKMYFEIIHFCVKKERIILFECC